MGSETQNVGYLGYRFDVLGSLPKATAASEAMVARGYVRGRGTSFRFSSLLGLTFKVTDSKATVTTEKTITFTHSHFVDPQQPTLAEIVAALNATLDDDATPTVASAGADGRLVITGAAAAADGEVTIGNGTANRLLGFPDCGVTVKYDNGTGIDIVLPTQFTGTGFGSEALHMLTPRVVGYTYTVATGVHAQIANFTATWTPSSRTLRLVDTGDAARQIHAIIEF